jgi:hypothetical protein
LIAVLLVIAPPSQELEPPTNPGRFTFPDGSSAINLAAARLRHIAGTRCSTKRYLNMELLRQRNAMIA